MVLKQPTEVIWRGMMRERILRRILDPDTDHRPLYRIARDSGAAYSWAYELTRDLGNIGAMKSTRVTRPDRIYSYWLRHHVPPLYSEYHSPDPLKLITGIDLDCAVTTYGADQAIQRFLFPRRYDVYIRREDAPAWHKGILRNGFVGGGNLRLLLHDPDILKTGETRRGLKVVCLPQLILDLIVEGGVCTEAARLLFKRAYDANPPLQWPRDSRQP